MTTKEIQLEDIVPNPFQPRKRVDPAEDIEGLALTIKKQKMLQIPSGRVSPSDPTKYQLAFGHRRYAAYQWLKDHGETGYDKMPINLVEMTDEEMFCAAVVENGERKDIDPFDEAGAMQVYQKQFGKNSKEIGELFHLSDSAVRNKIRLLDLPEIYRNLISEITESSARELLRFTNFPEAFRKAPAGIYSQELNYNNTYEENIINVIKNYHADQKKLHEINQYVIRNKYRRTTDQLWKDTEEFDSTEEGGKEIVGICKGCPLAIKNEGETYCGKPLCYQQKRALWIKHYLTAAAKACGLPLLEPEKYQNAYHTDFDFDESSLTIIRENGCVNLRIMFVESTNNMTGTSAKTRTLKKQGFPNAMIVCARKGGFCTCLTALQNGLMKTVVENEQTTVNSNTPDVTEDGKRSEIPVEENEGSSPIEKTAPVTEEKTNLMTEKELKKIRDLMKDQRKIDKEKLENLQTLVTKIVYESLLKQDLTTWLGALPNVNFYWLMGTHKKDITLADLCKKMATEYVSKACYSNELPSCLRAFNTLLTTCGLPNVTADGEIATPEIPNTDTSKKGNSGETPLQAEKTLAEIFTDEESKGTGKDDADELNKGQPGVDLLPDEFVNTVDSDPKVSNGEGDTSDTVADGKDNTLECEYVDLDPWPFVDRSDEQGA